MKAQRRQYLRLDSAFPVEFQLASPQEKNSLSEWLQGFTSNIGKGGLCLQVNNLKPELARLLKDRNAKLSLKIEMPLGRKPVNAAGVLAWMEEAAGSPGKYFIGLSYEQINARENKRIMRYAWGKKLFFPTAATAIIIWG